MQFALNSEQTLIDDTVERLFSAHAARNSAENEANSADLWQQLAQLGILGAALPESVGGTGGGASEHLIVARRMGRHLIDCAYLSSSVVGARILLSALDHGLAAGFAQTLLGGLIDGSQTVALALFEPGSRYAVDCAHTSTTAQANSRQLVLNGRKHFVLNGAQADWLIVAARQPGNEASAWVSLWAVPRDSAGLSVQVYSAFDGSSLASVNFEAVIVDAANCLTTPAQNGVVEIENALALGAFAASAQILGACEAAFEKTLDYLRVREQFGKSLSTFQALQHRASDCHAEMEMLRSLVLGASQTLQEGLSDQSRSDAWAAMVMAAEVGDNVGREAIQMHGAVGMTHDLGVGRYLMRINALARMFGDADEYRLKYLNYLDGVTE